jgi:hypothetical protein
VALAGYAQAMKEVIDAEFEVIRGPSVVQWQEVPAKPKMPLYKKLYVGLILIVAGYTLMLGLAGADLDTRDAVAADVAREPVAASLR